MKQWIRRLTTMALALCMCMSFVCAEVWAAESETDSGEESAAAVSEEAAAPNLETEDSSVVETAAELSGAEEEERALEEVDADDLESVETDAQPQEELTAQAVVSGTCGDNLSWTLDENGTLTISGTGEMWNWDYSSQQWKDYRNAIKKAVVQIGATKIGDFAFCCCSNLSSITIPTSVTSIEDFAFADCESLSSISIPSGVTSIGNNAFMHCNSLSSISIPSGVTNIEDFAFIGCESLSSISIPSGVTSIGVGAFGECTNLSSITIPSGVTSIGEDAFYGCRNLSSISIPSGVTSIEDFAFAGCESLSGISIPSGVTSIGTCAFDGCNSLSSITIPSSVTIIDSDAFDGCNNLIIKGEVSSRAQSFASEHNIPFEAITNEKANNKVTASNIKKTASGSKLSFTIGAKALGGAVLEYKCSEKSVTISDSGKVTVPAGYAGKFTVTIKAEETNNYYSASTTITVEIVPPEVSLKSMSSPQKGWIKVEWKAAKGISGYQLQVSESKDFKSGKQKKSNLSAKEKDVTMSGLKSKKTYYSRLRTYKKNGSKTYYGEWSKAKSVKVK